MCWPPCLLLPQYPNCLRSVFESLLFSTLIRYLSANFFLYLLCIDWILSWSSGCTTEVAFSGNIRNLTWEYSWTWWLDALSQTYSTWWPATLTCVLNFVIILWWMSLVIQAFFDAYQLRAMSFTCILYFFCKKQGVLALPMTYSFLWSDPSMFVIISNVSLSLCFAEPEGLSSAWQ